MKYRFGYCSVQKTGKCGGGCISQGETFQVTKEGNRKELIYVKGNIAEGVTLCFYHIFGDMKWAVHKWDNTMKKIETV